MHLVVLLVVALMTSVSGYAQTLNLKKLPTLTLVKQVGNPNTDVLSDPVQFVSEPGAGETRTFLLPVYIKNCLDSVNNPLTLASGEPIYSFRFKLQYNRTLLRAVGVQKRGPLPYDTAVAARDFNLSWDIDQDATYKLSTTGGSSANGERIMITGSSSIPLPLPKRSDALPNQNACQFRDTAVFLYIVFEVVGNSQGGSSGATRDQLILTRDSVMWNNYSLFPDQTMLDRGFDPNQEGVSPSPIFPITYPNNYGSAIIEITQRPRIDLLPPSQVVRINGDNSNYELTRPMQTQYGNNNFIARQILLVNGIAGTQLRNLTVETDEPWLRIDLNNPPQQGGTPPLDRGVYIRQVGLQQVFNVIANPNLLPTADNGNPPGYPTPGVYVGYVTIRSVDAINSAVRLRVELIVNRNPLESGLNAQQEPTQTRGIQLLLRNSAPSPDTTYLTFGTGVGATDNVDTLFGETEATTAPNQTSFYARFFPPSVVANNPGFRGLIDTRGTTPPSTNNESSLDIRNYKVNTTLVYCVNFSAGAPANYPVIVEYDTRDFPNGAQLFVRDNLNAQVVNINLREATSLGGTRYAFTIRDPNVKGFCIEYTLPAVVQFPEIHPGWNLVSLPVVPSDPRSGVVFPDELGKPLRFAANGYVPDDTVRVGVGYFVKYGSRLNRTVSGVQVKEINELGNPALGYPPFSVRVFKGWNTVGALSVPTTIDRIGFGPLQGGGTPNRIGEMYRYITDRGYEQTSILSPGLGYWINVDGDGYYRLVAPPGSFPKAAPVDNSYSLLSHLSVSDNSQKVGSAYFGQSATVDNGQFELPPVPASDMFDVRFKNNGFVSASQDAAAEHVVRIQGAQYPLVLSVDHADGDYVVSDAVTGEVFGSFKQGQAGAVRISNPMTKSVKFTSVLSSEMLLGEAFPNPTSTKASFSFNVPSEQNVTITLYNALGNEVGQLFNGRASGRQSVEIATENLPAGVYYYKMMTTSGFSQVRRIVVSR
jgi:hypothetical protein